MKIECFLHHNNSRKIFQQLYLGPPFKYKKGRPAWNALWLGFRLNYYLFYVIFIFGIANAGKHTSKYKFLMR